MVRADLEGTEEQVPPRITEVPEVLKQRIAHMREVTRHQFGPYIIRDQSAGLTGFQYKLKTAIDFQGKSVTIDKPLNRTGKTKEAVKDGISPVFRKPRRDKQQKHQPLCFFCGRKGHLANECKVDKSEWIDIEKLPGAVTTIA